MATSAPPLQPPRAIPLWERWRIDAPRLRYWVMTAIVALVVIAPLMREGLPVTQRGLVPLTPALADALGEPVNINLPLRLWTLSYTQSLALTTITIALLMGAVASWLWRGHGWWVASLTLTLPVLISTIYQRGNLSLLLTWGYFLFFIVLVLYVVLDRKTGMFRFFFFALVGIRTFIAIIQLAFDYIAAPITPHQLLLDAWADPLKWREWVGAPSFQIGIVPLLLGVLTFVAALPHRHQPLARRALALLTIAFIATGFTLLPGPGLLWLVLAVTALMLAIGALPVLDTRYAALPVQLGIVTIAVVTVYPYLQSSWFDPLNGREEQTVFGEEMLWLARVNVERVDDTVLVEAWWQTLKPMPQDYSVFVHFLNEQGTLVAQADALLVDAEEQPTTRWTEGYVVYRKYEAVVTEPIQEIRLGVYDVATLQRLPTYKVARNNTSGNLFPFYEDYLTLTDIP
jgi:hypothetical protein